MTADILVQSKSTGSHTILHTLALVFAALTLMFALLAVILGNRLSTLQTNHLASEIETLTTEAASIQAMETASKTAKINLETAQKALEAEKMAAEKLRRQLAGVMKDLEQSKADLASANQTIVQHKSRVAAETPQPETAPAADPAAEKASLPKPPPNNPTVKPSIPTQAPAQIPAVQSPEPSETQASVPPAAKFEKTVDTTAFPVTAPLSSDSAPQIAEETITDAAQPPAVTAPAAN